MHDPHAPDPHDPHPHAPDPHGPALRAGRLRDWAPLLTAVVLDVALIVAAVLALPGLPPRVPVHWGADGRPDRWEEAGLGTVAEGPLILLGLAVLMAGTVLLVRGVGTGAADPTAWQRFRTEGTVRGITALLGWTMLGTTLLVAPTTAAVLRGGDGAVAWWLMPLLVTVLMAGLLFGMGPLVRRGWRHMEERAAQAGVRPTPEEAAEDARWTPAGLLDDPEEPAVFVSKREGYGVGVTVNVGTPAGRRLVRGFVALFAGLLPLVLWVVAATAR